VKVDYIKQAWLVITLSLLFGAALAGVQVWLTERIETNKLNETLSQIPKLVPGSAKGSRETIHGHVVYRAMSDSTQVGWVIPASGQGFAAPIEVLIGVNREVSSITGLYVLDQRETPGLGNKITEADWLSQFEGKETREQLEASKSSSVSGNEIRAVTGATISSESICNIVNQTLEEFRADLQGAVDRSTDD